MAVSPEGNVAFAGTTNSPFIQTSSNAVQSNFVPNNQNIGANHFICEFNPSGEPYYRSYFGGGGEGGSQGGVAFTGAGNMVLGGVTFSPSFPTTPGAHLDEWQPFVMGTLAVFSPNRELLWSTLLGGAESDAVQDVAGGVDNRVYAVGNTRSEDLGTTGAYQNAITNSDENSGFLAAFSPDGVLDYFTYFQGDGSTTLLACEISPDGARVYVAGTTSSASGLVEGGIQDNFGGEEDVVLACFDAETGDLLWSRYFGGVESDGVVNLEIGDGGEIVFHGYTYSQEGIATSGAHQEVPTEFGTGGGADWNRYLAVLDEDGSTVWSTYFENASFTFVDREFGLAVSGNDIYIAGMTSSSEGIALAAPLEAELQDGDAQMMAKFDLTSGEQVWGTYLGTETFLRLNRIVHTGDSKIAVLGRTSADSPFVTPEAWQSTPNNPEQNAFYYAIFEESTVSTTEYEKTPLSVYPNPAVSEVRISVPGSLFGATDLRVFDLSGREVRRNRAFRSGEVLSIAGLPDGIYLLHLTDGDKSYRAKLAVAR